MYLMCEAACQGELGLVACMNSGVAVWGVGMFFLFCFGWDNKVAAKPETCHLRHHNPPHPPTCTHTSVIPMSMCAVFSFGDVSVVVAQLEG